MAKHKYATSPPNIATMPPGVPFIIGNEAAERFILGCTRSGSFHNAISRHENGAPDHMSDAEARGNFHNFVTAVYALPILGAILAETFWASINDFLAFDCLLPWPFRFGLK